LLKLTPPVRCITIVTVTAVKLPVLLNLSNSSLNHGPFALTTGVTVTPPVPPGVVPVTVNDTVAVRINVPLVPVTVTVAAPSVAVLAALNVSVLLLPVVAPGLNAAVTPAGNPLALNVTLPVKLVRVILIALVTAAPRATDTLAGVAVTVKFCAGFTVNVIVVVRGGCVPLVPVTVTVATPSVAVLDAVKVNVLVLPVVAAGLSAAVTPVGNPLALNVTLAGKLVRVMLIALVAVAPRVTPTLDGFAESVKFCVCTGFTVKLIVAVLDRLPLVPVTVTVAAPTVAVAEALKVNVLLLPVVDAGLNAAVTPVGSPLALSMTGSAKLVRAMLIVLTAVLP
jgi:hypothetical protein